VFRKLLLVSIVALLVIPLIPSHKSAVAQEPVLKIGFMPGVVDPFYQVMEIGINAAAEDLNIEVVTQYPDDWDINLQLPILEAYVARGDLDYIIIAPVDREQMVGPLQAALDAGIKIITVDTFIGDGDYVNGPVTFPISYIGSENVGGGRIAAEALADVLGETGKVFIENTTQGTSTVEQRGQGFREGIAEFPDMELVGEEWCEDDASIATQQVAAVLEREPELAGIFAVNVYSALGAGAAIQSAGLSGVVKTVLFDATVRAIELLRDGTADLVIAQKPFDMGYLAMEFALADARGVTSLPKRVPTGYAVITRDNVDDPEIARFIYQVP
jgi:ribose transport system substrate-binding protein